MSPKQTSWLKHPFLLASLVAVAAAGAVEQRNLPKQDVVEVPAIAPGLCVANLFQSNMVLQRGKPLNIWGWAEPGEEVTVSFAGQQVQAKAATDRSWQVTLAPIPANTKPQSMAVRGKSATLTLENILVGDVWVLGGQSNMEFPISKVDDGELEIISANFPQLRLLTMPVGKGFASVHSFERLYEWSDWSMQHFRKGDWDVCSPETVQEFSAIGYVFGRRLGMATGVPIGLIDASIGGTTVETWTPEDVLRKIEGAETRAMLKEWDDKIAAFAPQADLKARVAAYENRMKNLQASGQAIPPDSKPPSDLRPGPVADQNRPGCRYASVIQPLRGLAVAGAVFHQGFNNCFNGSAGARMYYQVFGRMIAAWRTNFDDPQLPFCIISLCTAGDPQTLENFLPPTYDAGPYIREAQYQTFLDLRGAGDKNIGFVSSFDLRKSWYHPQIKIPAGERAAKWALVTRYRLLKGRDAGDYWLPPMVEKVEVAAGTIRLTMSTEVKTRDDSDGKLLGFAIAGEDRRFYPADANWFSDGSKNDRNRVEYDKHILVLSNRLVPKPVHYRYAWARNPLGNVVNNRGVPLACQRSDDWLLEETPVKLATTDDASKRQVADHLRKMLEQDDLERRLQEAEATLTNLKPILEKAQAAGKRKNAADARKVPAGAQK
jgi:sialate O-acetylesterase